MGRRARFDRTKPVQTHGLRREHCHSGSSIRNQNLLHRANALASKSMSRITRKRAQTSPFRSVNDSVLDAAPEPVIQRDSLEREETIESESSGRQAHAIENADAANAGDRRRLMSAFSIDYDGRHYRYNGYRYDRLADAVSYAKLMQSRQTQHDTCPMTYQHVESPSEPDRAVMARYSITFSEGMYRYSGFRYDRLADALNYAESLRRQHARAK